MKIFLKILLGFVTVVVLIIIGLFVYLKYFSPYSEPNWQVERNAIPSKSHPLAGFYKDESCKDEWGLAIGPANETQYYISFCGPGGCFPEGRYRPNTTIYNDPNYEVIDENTIKFKNEEGWTTHVRCHSRT